MLTDKHFIDWYADVFGYGYGTGDEHFLLALKTFLYHCSGENGSYSYKEIEAVLTPAVTWFTMNTLCQWEVDVLEYGTSPRFGWLTGKGRLLAEYVENKTVDELYEKVMVDESYGHCLRNHCNCDTPCNNPLFSSKR
jgi:hypothetical protein